VQYFVQISIVYVLFDIRFKRKTAFLYLFGVLFGVWLAVFRLPKNRFLVVKTHFLHHFSVQRHVTRLSNFGQKTPFQSAKCSTLFCVLLHFTLRFAAFRTAFCGTLHCVLLHFALLFTAKAQLFCIVCVFMQYSTGQHTVVCSTYFYLNNPLQYSIFCGRVAGWMILMPLFVLEFVLKR